MENITKTINVSCIQITAITTVDSTITHDADQAYSLAYLLILIHQSLICLNKIQNIS
jgi:hypothetical protein